MPLIYSRATAVFVYIGESTVTSSSTLMAIATYDDDGIDPLRLTPVREGLLELWSRRYFSRVWVLQEVALARKFELICGDTMIPWRYIGRDSLARLGVFGMAWQIPIPPVLHFDHRVFTQPDRFLDLLHFASSNCGAHDPRDMVYSLLGLVIGSQVQGLEADYSLSVDQVYVNTTLSLGRHFGWRLVFQHALARRPRIPNLPSWAPDWSAPRSSSKLPTTRPLEDTVAITDPLRVELRALVYSALRVFTRSETSWPV